MLGKKKRKGVGNDREIGEEIMEKKETKRWRRRRKIKRRRWTLMAQPKRKEWDQVETRKRGNNQVRNSTPKSLNSSFPNCLNLMGAHTPPFSCMYEILSS